MQRQRILAVLVLVVSVVGCSRFEPIAPDSPDVTVDTPDVKTINLCADVTCESDDLPPCYSVSCDASTGQCVYQAWTNGTSCVDSDPCTTNTQCQDGVCAGMAVECPDPGPCQRGVCQPEVGCTIENRSDGLECDDGNACTHQEVCIAGVCQASSETVCVQADCPQIEASNSDCQECRCNTETGICMDYVVNAGGPCNADNDGCTVNDRCSAKEGEEGLCVAGLSPICDDGVTCTIDACFSSGTDAYECVVTFDGSGCYVDGPTCVPSGAFNPTNDCETCAPEISAVSWSMADDGAPCSDGDGCTSGDACDAGFCAAGAPMICEDSFDCTSTYCQEDSDTEGHCQADVNPGSCLIKDLCVTEGVGNPNNACQGCHWSSDPKAWTPVPVDTACNADDDGCTVGDSCSLLGVCEPGMNGSLACDDDVSCTIDVCEAVDANNHQCTNVTEVGCMIDGNCFGDQASNPENPCQICAPIVSESAWSNVPPWAGVACDADGDGCTTPDQCLSGACVAGNSLSCDDGQVCTVDVCVSTGVTSSQCENTVMANWCVIDKVCIPNGSASMNNPCLFCDAAINQKQWVALTSGTACNDGTACTEFETCQNGACVGQAVECGDENPCTDDDCDPVEGCNNVPNTNACDDGIPCTVGDACSWGQCVPGTKTDCPCLMANQARRFGSHCLNVSKSASVLGNAGFTVDFWMRTTDVADAVVMGKETSPQVGGDADWAIHHAGGDLTFSFGVTGQPDGTFSTAGAALNDGQWHHIALTRQASAVMRWYLDGVMVAIQSVTDNIPFGNNATLTMGCTGTGQEKWDGDLDEVRLSDFARYQTNFSVPGRHVVDIATRALWHLDEDSQTLIVVDGTGNGFDAVLSNGVGKTTGDVAAAFTVCCGNGTLESGEACDDLNAALGDGCSNQCDLEGGPLTQSGVFDGEESCLSMGSEVEWGPISAYTIEFWLKTTDKDSYLMTWTQGSGGTTWTSESIELTGKGRLQYAPLFGDSVYTDTIVADGQWHHAALSCQPAGGFGTTCTWFVDGSQDGDVEQVNTWAVGGTVFSAYFGCKKPGKGFYEGLLDEIRWTANTVYVQVPFIADSILSPGDGTEFFFNFDQPIIDDLVTDLSAHQRHAILPPAGSLSLSADTP